MSLKFNINKDHSGTFNIKVKTDEENAYKEIKEFLMKMEEKYNVTYKIPIKFQDGITPEMFLEFLKNSSTYKRYKAMHLNVLIYPDSEAKFDKYNALKNSIIDLSRVVGLTDSFEYNIDENGNRSSELYVNININRFKDTEWSKMFVSLYDKGKFYTMPRLLVDASNPEKIEIKEFICFALCMEDDKHE